MANLINYALDTTGLALANRVSNENHVITKAVGLSYNFYVPDYAPFFGGSFQARLQKPDNSIITLVEGTHFHYSHKFITASRQLEKEVYGSVTFLDPSLEGLLIIDQYQTLGGEWTIPANLTTQILSDVVRNPRVIAWEQVANLPYAFPPMAHPQDASSIVGAEAIVAALNLIATTISNNAGQTTINLPIVIPSKNQIGLGLVANLTTATDEETISGVSRQRYVTPANVRAALLAALASFEAEYTASSQPSSGSWTAGRYVRNISPVRLTHPGPGLLQGQTVVVKGWLRLTTGNLNVTGTDWVTDYALVA